MLPRRQTLWHKSSRWGLRGSTRQGVWSDDTIEYATVDNENYTYFLEVSLLAAAEDIELKGVVLWEPPVPIR